jgi:hypothetical protein
MGMTGDGVSIYRQDRLGDQLASYRRRPEKDILRDMGASPLLYYMSPLFVVLGAALLSAPLVLMAPKPNPGESVLAYPVWGPVIIVWFVVCLGAVAWFTYILPRRSRLTIHQNGFIYQGVYRRHVVLFEDIAACEAPRGSFELLLVLNDSRKLHFGNFRIMFPADGVVRLLEAIAAKMKPDQPQASHLKDDMRTKLRRIGLAVGALLVVLVAVVPVTAPDQKGTMVKAFGPHPLGVPCRIFATSLFMVLFCPFVYVLMHLFILKAAAWPRFAGLYDPAELRKSRIVVTLGLVYFIALVAVWAVHSGGPFGAIRVRTLF